MNAAPEIDEAAPVPEAAAEPTTAQPHVTNRGLFIRFREYVWDWRAVVAVGIAMFVIGGLAGLGVGLAMDNGSHSPGTRNFRGGPGGDFGPGRQGGFNPGGQGFGGQPGGPGINGPTMPAQ